MCAKAACNSGWDDCDGGLDCERNVNPPAMGGLGPCMPDSNCTKVVRNPGTPNAREYYFCNTARSWTAARAQCRLQSMGDLVRINDTAENDFVRTNLAGDAWIGASDSTLEGAWLWVDNDTNTQFWAGAAAASPVPGIFQKWNAGEPNDSGANEDCAMIWTAGAQSTFWNDQDCASALRFVCEVQVDECPGNTKLSAGQCGCATADVHSDNDGVADCNDTCPIDGSKTAPGMCGCGVPDADADGDGVLNCLDQCPAAPDTDSDADGTADCVDGCDYDAARTSGACVFSYTATNVPTGSLDFGAAPDLNANCGERSR